MNITRLTPTPRNPTSPAAATVTALGNAAPVSKASATLTPPAINPLSIAMTTGSVAEIIRVKLLSMPQATQAAITSSEPESKETPSRFHESRTAPARKGESAKDQSLIDIFAEDDPGDRHRGQTFDVEQKRGAGRRRVRQAEHKQHWPNDAAHTDCNGEPRDIRSPQLRFVTRLPERAAKKAIRRQTQTRAKIHQTRKHERADRIQQEFGQGGYSPE